ncbi:MAG: GTPase/DUF3482 domain-containing protein [Pseudohongiellaceae bacterium]
MKYTDSPLRIAVVGHTNTGKTSLLRTLTRDQRFGAVSFQPGTTRHVEMARLRVEGREALELYDTPGLEDPIALLEMLESMGTAAGARMDGPARINRFLESESAAGRFEQEAKVLRQLLHSDAAFYVIDARDPVLGKYRDELALLAWCGVPLLPLLNFVADPRADEPAWRDMLARAGLHAIVRFDTVAPGLGSERLLYEKLATLIDGHRERLLALVESHEQDARDRRRAALGLIADLLLDVAADRAVVRGGSGDALATAAEALNGRVRAREQQCLEALLDLYRFTREDIELHELPVRDGRWENDLFDPDTLQLMGVRVGGGAAAGAASGLGIDLMVGGATLGAATAIGALAGGSYQTLRHYGNRILGMLGGEQHMRVQDDILVLLAWRQMQLLRALEGRGHAATAAHRLETAETGSAGDRSPWQGELPGPLRQARARPEWLENDGAVGRPAAIRELQEELFRIYSKRSQSTGDRHGG